MDYLVTHNLQVEDINTNDDFLDLLFTRFAQYNNEWQGITSVKDIQGSEVKRRLCDHIRNQKRKGDKLMVQINAARELMEDDEES